MKPQSNPFLRAALLAASVILTTGAASAATLGTWTATAGKTLLNASTASPTLGDGTNNGASAILYASFPTITLTNVGDYLTLSGSFTLAGGVAGVNQAFRFGLFDNNGSTDAMNWRGYLGVTSPDANTIFERFTQTSGDFLSTNVASTTALTGTNNSGNGYAPASGAFTFSETITKTATGVSLSYSVTGPSGYSWSGSNTDTTPNFGVTPIEYDRVGLGFSGGYTADQAVFSNITVVPEPGAALLSGLGMLCLLRRRRA